MIKYNKILDNRNLYYLPLIDLNENGKKEVSPMLPVSFYQKYSDLFRDLKIYVKIFGEVDIDKYFDSRSNIDYDSYLEACAMVSEYYGIKEIIERLELSVNSIEMSSFDIECNFRDVKRILILLSNIYVHNKEFYLGIAKRYDNVLKEIVNYKTIMYNAEMFKYKKVYLPDFWFILPNGFLYNTGNGHKGSSLLYDYDNVKSLNKNKDKLSIEYYNIAMRIMEKGFTLFDYKEFLNGVYTPAFLDDSQNVSTCCERHVQNVVLGVVLAKYYFYRFFESLIEVNNYQLNLEKIVELTNGSISDILVRCCNFHKVESMVDRTITTSCINYEEVLKDYIDRGWKVQFIPPIIINNEKECVEEYPNDFLIIRKLLKSK